MQGTLLYKTVVTLKDRGISLKKVTQTHRLSNSS